MRPRFGSTAVLAVTIALLHSLSLAQVSSGEPKRLADAEALTDATKALVVRTYRECMDCIGGGVTSCAALTTGKATTSTLLSEFATLTEELSDPSPRARNAKWAALGRKMASLNREILSMRACFALTTEMRSLS